MKKSLNTIIASGATTLTVAVMLMASSMPAIAAPKNSAAPGNNGTLKVHEIGTPSGTENNDPKVCAFNLESFGLDQAQTGYLQFTVQGPNGSAPSAQYAFGPANTDGYAVSQTFNSTGVKIADGRYKVTLYGKDTSKKGVQQDDEKAKTKVFTVDCAADVESDNSPKPEKTNTPGKPTKHETPVETDKQEVPGNNGTLKVHEIGTPVKQINNDPQVCAFDIEGFKFDSGQTGYLKFNVQGNDAPHGVASEAVYAFGPTDTEGYAISATKFNTKDGVTIANGHYKVTLYGKADLKDEKAKSKVFKVSCETTPVTPTTPQNPVTPSNAGQVLGSTTAATVTAAAGKMQNTGTSILASTLLAVSLLTAAIYVSKKRLPEAGLDKDQIELIAL